MPIPRGISTFWEELTSLVEMSLVRLDETGSEPRFRMLETIREYAVDRLSEAGEDAAIRERHAAFYLAFAEAAEPELSARTRWRGSIDWLPTGRISPPRWHGSWTRTGSKRDCDSRWRCGSTGSGVRPLGREAGG